MPARLRGKDWELIPTSRRVVALTFDAGSSADGVDSILATLRATGTTATFFLTGDFVRRFPAQARRIAASYPVGNHTASHADLTQLSDAGARVEITQAQSRIRTVTGADPRPWFRFPFGARNARTIADVNGQGYVAVRWTVDTLGWQGVAKGGRSVASVTQRVLAGARPGAIVLMHVGANPDDGSTLDAAALRGVISGLQARGYTFVTLQAMFG